ncbi:MAG: hypothetical protein MUC50_06320 [Myxococcota bacterium]|jgi:flagellar motor switch protein FliG|nr:hypothetical protein [Myxococcota bacterium]
MAAKGQELMTLEKPIQALLIVLSLEEEAVARVLRFLEPDDIKLLHELAQRNVKADASVLQVAYRNFLQDAQQPLLAPGEGKAYIERLAQRSLGREESKSLFSGKDGRGGLSSLERRSPQMVSKILAEENPGVIAAVLAELSPPFASSVVRQLPRETQVKVITRLAHIDEIPTSTIESLWTAVEDQLADIDTGEAIVIDGVSRAAGILQRLPIAETDEVLTSMGEEEPGLAHRLRRAMFSFEDLVNVQGRGTQMLIKEISNDQLLLALKTASDALKDKVLGSVSKRAAEILVDDLMAMGPAKLSEVEQAQQEIVDTALRLEAEGKIVIAGRGGEELV